MIARAASRTWTTSSGAGLAPVVDSLHGARDADRAGGVVAAVEDRRRDRGLADHGLLALDCVARASRTASSARSTPARVTSVACVSGGSGRASTSARELVVVRQQRLAERRRVERQVRSDLEDLQRVVRPEDVVDDEHAVIVERADAHGLAGADREVVGPGAASGRAAR